MICQRFLTPAGSGFRKAQPDWNLLSGVGLDLGSARGLLQLQRRGALRMPSIQLHSTTLTMAEWLYIRAAQECFFINSQQYALRAVWANVREVASQVELRHSE
ncbi:unnamed protein product [Durusdinium trenchii]|uniref:Uncharacterized protein n=1 Tax=Durusdinium trenchii TaxID=1381693 RepID=A0ABP0P827_9DINO